MQSGIFHVSLFIYEVCKVPLGTVKIREKMLGLCIVLWSMVG